MVVLGRVNDVRALPRADPPGRQRISDDAHRHHRRRAGDLQPVLCTRCKGGRPRHSGGGRQGGRRRFDRWRTAIARDLALESVVADLDLAFGTAGLDYNQDPPQGIADAVFSPDRVDTAFVDRLLSKCTDHLSLLAAPATLDRVYDFAADTFDTTLDSLRSTIPCIVLDVPHQWTAWTKRILVSADDILVVAGPDLANLRNAKNLIDLLRSSRPNDHRPHYCLNQVGVPKRPEITPADFAKALESEPLAVIPFEPQLFGSAANNGQMISEMSANHKTSEMFRQMAQALTGRAEMKRSRSSLLSPLLTKFMKRAG